MEKPNNTLADSEIKPWTSCSAVKLAITRPTRQLAILCAFLSTQHYTTMQTRNAGGHRLIGVHRSLPAPAPLRRRCFRKPVHLIIRIRSCRYRAAAAAAPLPAKFEAEA
ncbi:hypothetical protein SFRURICE_015211 [Spodoptera frugiperda]|nr:hypothetical protein SFRURICE_015211 [Spodoptera frugiperda]